MIEQIKYQYSIANDHKVIRLCNEFLNQTNNSNNFEVLNYKAQSHKNLFQDREAIQTYQKIMNYFPKIVKGYIMKAICLIDVGEFEEARDTLHSALEIETENLDALNNLMFVEEQLHNFERVIELSKIAIEIDNSDPSVWQVLGSAHERLGNYKESIIIGIQALEKSKSDPIYLQMAHNNLGYTYSKIGELQKAKFHLEEAIKLNDSEPYALNNLGLVLAKLGNQKAGLDLINHSINLDSRNSYAYRNRAKIYIMEENLKLAKRDLERAKELNYELDYDNEVNELLNKI